MILIDEYCAAILFLPACVQSCGQW